MKEVLQGKVTGYDERTGAVTLTVNVPAADYLRELPSYGLIRLADGRKMTHEQRKLCYALISEIAEWAGELPEIMKKQLKLEFKVRKYKEMLEEFSLSDAEQSVVSEFIRFLIDIVLEYGVPLDRPLSELCEDIEHMIYACLTGKKCCVCGRKAELHHIDRIGVGNDRREAEHIGRRCLPLCREHHDMLHVMGDRRFIERYHLSADIRIDEKIAKIYGLGRRKR